MSALFNQTNISPGTTNFITRAEVINGFSTLVGDLSGVNISSIFLNPNPLFSSITMNATGSIGGGAAVSATGALGLSTAQFAYSSPYGVSGPFIPSLKAAATTTYQALGIGGAIIKPGAVGGQFYTTIAPTSAAIFNATNQATPIWSINTTTPSLAFTNISSINGLNPNTTGTTFTNLTGSNLTTTGTLTSPQVVSVSSINGVLYSTAYTNIWSGGGSTSVPTGVPTIVASITLPAGFLRPNTNYTFDVPILVGALPPSPIGFVLFIGCRLGSNGNTNYQIPLYIAAGSGGVPLQITGVATTNSVSIASQTIDIIVLQQSGSTWICPISNPTTGLNTYAIKPLT